MNDLTFIILKITVTVLSVLISIYVIPLLKEKIHDKKYEQLLLAVDMAVRAAEQTIGAGAGSIKKENVIKFVRNWAASYGIDISESQLDALIEAAVFNMNREVD